MMDIKFQGYVSAAIPSVSLNAGTGHINIKEGYTPTRGPNSGKNMGPVVFLIKGTPTVRQTFATAAEALLANADSVPEKTRVYVNGAYTPYSKALEMDLEPFYWKSEDKAPSERTLYFMTAAYVAKKNSNKTPTRIVKAISGNLPSM